MFSNFDYLFACILIHKIINNINDEDNCVENILFGVDRHKILHSDVIFSNLKYIF